MKNSKKRLSKSPNVVVIGGGTGLSILLRGLKQYTSNITAIVTVADDGGGSGVLREDLGMLPPGDIRACLLALANTEPSMEKLFNHRFTDGILKNQSMGNLLIAAMNDIYGSFDLAIREISNVLAVTGKVLPMTLSDVNLCAVLTNGKTIKGESKIPLGALKEGCKIDRIYTEPKISYPLMESVEAIENADVIVLGPGSLYTSVIPNLLVNDMVLKIRESKASKVYIANVMTQSGETDGYTVYDHVDAIIRHSSPDFIDYVIANDQEIEDSNLERYREDGSRPVILTESDQVRLESDNIRLIKDNLVEIKDGYIRHNNRAISEIIMEIGRENIKKNKLKDIESLPTKEYRREIERLKL